MRSWILQLLLFILVLTCSGCSGKNGIDTSTDYKSNLIDGTYTVSSTHYDSYGFKKTLTLSIHDGILSQVNYREINKDNELRANLPESKVPWKHCEYSYLQLKPLLYERSILSQGEHIDAISGATKTCNDYQKLLEEGMEIATKGTPQEQLIDTFSDVYTLVNEADPVTNGQEEITARFTDGVLTSISIQELQSNKPLLSQYSLLADTSTRLKSIENLTSSQVTVDPVVLERYNGLLEQLREARGI